MMAPYLDTSEESFSIAMQSDYITSNPPVEQYKWRTGIEASLGSIKQTVTKSLPQLPSIRDTPGNGDGQNMTGMFSDLRRLGYKDAETLVTLLNAEAKGYQDDNDFLLENLVTLLSKLDIKSGISQQLTGGFVNTLWNSLPHPPLTMLGDKYKYREADGSFNNIRSPSLGAANSPYARSARPCALQDIALPDPGVIFDSLMARGETFEPHPNKLSSMLFYLATLITHDIFRTDHSNFNNTLTSSYLDLAPLYGSNQDEQNTIRTFKEGKIKKDCFADKRILGFPPGVGVLVIMFNRFHNHVVTQLALINERRRFTRPKDDAPQTARDKYDNDLFQTGRLITCGLYVNIILKDYVRTILNLDRVGTKWDLDPRAKMAKTMFSHPAAEGIGNQVSVEFNLVYRWHSALSNRDAKYIENMYAGLFPGRDPEQVTLPELLGRLKAMQGSIPADPIERPFANLTRQSDGTFDDDALVDIFASSVSDIAGSFGANKVPRILRSVEILGIMQARSWDVASLNEFRQFSGLTKHETFEDINPDPVVAQKLRELYDHPDSVELYPGLVAEKPKPPMTPGSGLCVNFTTSYAILSDAVALVRGDRFYTIDYTPKNLTNWGFSEVQYDIDVDDGCVMHKLIHRAFPNHFKTNSIYAHYPFVVPRENALILKSLGKTHQYSWEKPIRKPDLVIVKSHTAAKNILTDTTNWRQIGPNDKSQSLSLKSLSPVIWQIEVKTFYEQITTELLQSKSHKVAGTNSYQIDIVKDVASLVNTRFAATVFDLPIKTEDCPTGICTEKELHSALSSILTAISIDADVARSMHSPGNDHIGAQRLADHLSKSIGEIAGRGFIASCFAMLHESDPLTDYGTQIIRQLLDANIPVKDIIWSHLLPTAASIAAYQATTFCQALDFYLTKGAEYIPELYRLSKERTKAADDTILHYFMEGARLNSTIGIFRDYKPAASPQTATALADNNKTLTVHPNQRILIDVKKVSHDPTAFPSPDEVRLDRPLDSYIYYQSGTLQCGGVETGMTAMTTMFKTVFGLKSLRRARGCAPGGGWYGENQGEMKRLKGPHGMELYMSADQSGFSLYPTTMKIQWDSEN